jgi:PAS domain-containing protein
MVYAVARDVTGLRETARQLEALNQELSSMNEELAAMNEELVATNEDLVAEVEQRQRAERDLTVARARLEAILENMDSGVAVYEARNEGEDFIFARFNRGAERIERLDRSQVLGKGLTEVFPGAEDFGMVEALRRVHRTGRAERLPLRFYRDPRISGWRQNFVYRLDSGELVALYSDETRGFRPRRPCARARSASPWPCTAPPTASGTGRTARPRSSGGRRGSMICWATETARSPRACAT